MIKRAEIAIEFYKGCDPEVIKMMLLVDNHEVMNNLKDYFGISNLDELAIKLSDAQGFKKTMYEQLIKKYNDLEERINAYYSGKLNFDKVDNFPNSEKSVSRCRKRGGKGKGAGGLQNVTIDGNPDIIMVEDVVKLTGFTRSHIYHLTSTCAIPYYKPLNGTHIYFSKREIERWLEDRYAV